MCWSCVGHVLVTYWPCIGHVLVMCWSCVGHVLVMYWSCIGHVSQPSHQKMNKNGSCNYNFHSYTLYLYTVTDCDRYSKLHHTQYTTRSTPHAVHHSPPQSTTVHHSPPQSTTVHHSPPQSQRVMYTYQIVVVVQPVLDFGGFDGVRVGLCLKFQFMLVLQIPHPPLSLFVQPVLQRGFLPFLFRVRAFRQQLHVVGEFRLKSRLEYFQKKVKK
jgi:hypothetical protein